MAFANINGRVAIFPTLEIHLGLERVFGYELA
jgi:hypothetical protein